MNSLEKEYGQFLNKIVLHEQNLIDGKIAIKDLKAWEDFKIEVKNLERQFKKLIEDTSNVTTMKKTNYLPNNNFVEEDDLSYDNKAIEQNCMNYVDFLSMFIMKIESQYKNIFSTLLETKNVETSKKEKEIIETIFYQLQTLCKYVHLGEEKNLIVEQSEFDKHRPSKKDVEYCEVTDYFGKTYTIEKIFAKDFQALCEQEKITKEETNQVYTCVFGITKEKLTLTELYDKKIAAFRMNFLNKNYKITTLNEWDIFKKQVNRLKINYESLTKNLMVVEKMTFHGKNGKSQNFIDLLENCIQTTEEKQNGSIKEEEIPFFIENIYNICKYKDILESKKEILLETRIYKRTREDVEIVTDLLGAQVEVKPTKTLEYTDLVNLQSVYETKYKEAYDLIFEELKEEQDSKRGM